MTNINSKYFLKNLWWNDWNWNSEIVNCPRLKLSNEFVSLIIPLFSADLLIIFCVYIILRLSIYVLCNFKSCKQARSGRPVEDCDKYSYCSLLTYHWQGLFVCSLWELTVHSSQCRAVFLWPNDHKVILHLSSCRFWIFKNDFV